MNGSEGAWSESELYCTACDEVVTLKGGPDGFIMMRCRCIEKAGHREIEAERWWLHRSCRGDERAMRMEAMHAEMDAYSD
jgi:phage FluMu protein Com